MTGKKSLWKEEMEKKAKLGESMEEETHVTEMETRSTNGNEPKDLPQFIFPKGDKDKEGNEIVYMNIRTKTGRMVLVKTGILNYTPGSIPLGKNQYGNFFLHPEDSYPIQYPKKFFSRRKSFGPSWDGQEGFNESLPYTRHIPKRKTYDPVYMKSVMEASPIKEFIAAAAMDERIKNLEKMLTIAVIAIVGVGALALISLFLVNDLSGLSIKLASELHNEHIQLLDLANKAVEENKVVTDLLVEN